MFDKKVGEFMKGFMLLGVCLILLASCATSSKAPSLESVEDAEETKNDETPSPSSVPVPTPEPTPTPPTSALRPGYIPTQKSDEINYEIKEEIITDVVGSIPDKVSETFRQVLLSKTTFHRVFDWEGSEVNTTLYDFFLNDFSDDAVYNLEFAVADLDGDGIPEIIVNVRGPDERLILHYKDGVVYGYFVGIRSFQEIKGDGTFAVSYGMFGGGVASMRFTENGYEEIWLHRRTRNNYDEPFQHFIGNEEVTEDEYRASADVQNNKDEVEWHDLYLVSE
jgi:hypothetical protein